MRKAKHQAIFHHIRIHDDDEKVLMFTMNSLIISDLPSFSATVNPLNGQTNDQ
jgi:hypothetical protein